MRVYVATTMDGLRALRDKGFDPPVSAHAVTPALREWYVEGDAEELEYAASSEAAHASLRLLALAPGARRRVVVAAEVPDGWVRPDATSRSAVRVAERLALQHVVSVHVDDAAARADVSAAAAAVPAADAGDADAEFTVDAADGHELLWYDVTELDDVLALP